MIKITYYGHSCFVIDAGGYIIALDPYDTTVPGYKPLQLEADEVLCSHEHGDHNYTKAVRLSQSGRKNPFKITELSGFHDSEGGRLRGTNIIRIFEYDGIRIAHFGDIGCRPDDDQIEVLKDLDAALIPVGGFFTLDAAREKALMSQLKPRIVIPMHYRHNGCGYDAIADLSEFTDLYRNVGTEINYAGHHLEIDESTSDGIYVLDAE